METVNPYVLLLLNHLLEIVGAGLLGLVGALVAAFSAYLNKKWHLTIDDAQQAKTVSVIDNGITHAEEWAHNKIKTAEGDESKLPTGAQKMEQAVKFIQAELTAKGIPAMVEARIIGWINARLGTARADATSDAIALSNDTGTPLPSQQKPPAELPAPPAIKPAVEVAPSAVTPAVHVS